MRTNKKISAKAILSDAKIKALFLSALTIPFAGNVIGQEEQDAAVLEELIVTGTRQVIRDRIDIKRSAVQIVDGLSASDIGDLPALSIGEALESISGASSHRENGGATEISIRGLGPFLSATHFNGREATNGSGDRSVNFSQFPSELMNKLAIVKTQDASMIEGGVAGVIQLETLKPLDYDERRFQFDAKGNYNPDQQDINDSQEGDLGYRITGSYVDQFEFSNGSRLGISLGYQDSAISQPEAEVRSSSPTGTSRWACLNDPTITTEGAYRSGTGDCEDQTGSNTYPVDVSGSELSGSSSNEGYNTIINPDTGLAYSDGTSIYWAPSSRGYRTNDTSDTRDAFFFAAQFQPDEDWDINLDVEVSERVQQEERHDLNFANQKRTTVGVTPASIVTTESGAILAWEGGTAIESNSELFNRTEKYKGGGLSLSNQVNDRLRVSADLSYSQTTRTELQVSLRTQSDNEDIFDGDTPGGYRPNVAWDRRDSGIPQYTITNFDVTDHTLFSDQYRVRVDSDVDRENTISAFRTDFEYDIGGDFITSIEAGVRYAKLEYVNLGNATGGGATTRVDPGSISRGSDAGAAAIQAINQACRNEVFPEDGFLSAQREGNLVTNVDDDGSVISSGTGNSWATFDTQCVADAIFEFNGSEFAYPEQVLESLGTTDVTESTNALYVKANFETSLGDTPLRGNFGVRMVDTSIDSFGYRTPLTVITDPDTGVLSLGSGDGLERVRGGGDYTELLPSFTYVLDVSDEVIIRGGLFKGLSRVDPSDMSYSRTFDTASADGDDGPTSVDDLITGARGTGNPNTSPLTSWNVDTSFEWYPNEDSYLAVGLYYKQFTGGLDQITTLEDFDIDGQAVTAAITLLETTDDESDLYGVEITGSHRFSYLPEPFDGFGFKASYNYADSNFEFEDSNYGDLFTTNLDGSVSQSAIGLIPPGNVPGFSEQVFSGQLYYQIGELDIAAIYKYRSEYFQPYTSNGTRLRYVGDVGVWEASVAYRINDNFRVKLQAINLFDEPKEQFFYVDDELGEVNSYGSRIFLGLSAKF